MNLNSSVCCPSSNNKELVFTFTISGRFNCAITSVTMLPATSVDKNSTIQIHGLSYSHLRKFVISIQSGVCPGPDHGPRKRTLTS